MNQGLNDSVLVSFKDRSQWLDGRAVSIGSSDARSILGIGYTNESYYAKWAEKAKGIRRPIDKATQKMFDKGKAAEPYIAALCKIEHGWDIQFDPTHSYRRSRHIEYCTASLDGWFIDRQGRHNVVEYKNVNSFEMRNWSSEGKAPLKYTIQVQHQLLVTGWEHGWLVALNGYDVTAVPVPRHDDLIAAMKSEYAEFWDLVVNQIEPDPDHKEASRLAAQQIHPPKKAAAKHLDESETQMLLELRRLDEETEKLEKERERLRNQLVKVSRGATLLVTNSGKWYSFKGIRGGKPRLKPQLGRIRT
ncbi:MAG: YqaJ viral recombinase family protein [bacterium]|nr:YqaJ viral recombinase family protein [bacterium]